MLKHVDYSFAFLDIGSLIFYLDFAMWLCIEHDGESQSTAVSLVKEPRAALEEQVTRRLAEHRDEVVWSYSLCPRCESEYFIEPVPGRCESVRGEDHHRCGAELVRMYRIDEGENWLREQAGMQLARLHDITSRRAVVCAWLTQDLGSGHSDDEIKLPLCEVLALVRGKMQERFDSLGFHLAHIADRLPFRGRRDFLPRGHALAEQHRDYLVVRDSLQNTYNSLRGLTRDHPEFVERDESPRAPEAFSPPVPLSAIAVDGGASAPPTLEQDTAVSDPLGDARKSDDSDAGRSLGLLSLPDLYKHFGIPKAKRKALSVQLGRWRQKHLFGTDWVENGDVSENSSKRFLYRPDAVATLIEPYRQSSD